MNNDLRIRLVVSLFLWLSSVVQAAAPPIDLTKVIDVVASEIWPQGKVPAGTGFFVGSEGQILTPAHVIAGCHGIDVTASRGGHIEHAAALLVGVDGRIDAAILLTPSIHSKSYLRFTDSLPDVSDPLLVAIRSADGSAISSIVVRAIENPTDSTDGGLLHLDGRLNPGSSGAPVMDTYGDAVGYVIGRMRDSPHVALAVPAKSVEAFLRYFNIAASLKSKRGIPGIIGAFKADRSSSGFDSGRISELTVLVKCH